jgi:hypothetical protein
MKNWLVAATAVSNAVSKSNINAPLKKTRNSRCSHRQNFQVAKSRILTALEKAM